MTSMFTTTGMMTVMTSTAMASVKAMTSTEVQR